MARSVEFYENGLGLPGKDSPPDVAFFPFNGTWLGLFGRQVMADEASASIDATSVGVSVHAVTLAHIVQSLAEVDAVVAAVKAAGGIISRDPAPTSRGGYSG